MAVIDLQPILTPVLQVGGLVIAGLLTSYVPRALAAFQARTGITLTDQQRAAVLGAVQTASGIIETHVDQGLLSVAHVQVDNPTVLLQARAVLSAVPQAAAALGMTEDGVARMIVGKVDTLSRVAPTQGTTPNAA